MKGLRFIVLLLMVIGSLNWGLVGFFEYNLIADVFGGMTSMTARVHIFSITPQLDWTVLCLSRGAGERRGIRLDPTCIGVDDYLQ